MDKLSAMATFVAVAESGSFTRAAELLDLPNARVSQRISDLERYLGVRLLQRTTRALHLTVDGEVYLSKCQHILKDITELEGALKHGTLSPRGKLRVDALVSVARWIIAPHLHAFHARYPLIAVRLGSSDQIRHLLEDGVDCVIRGGALESSTQIARHLGDVHVGLYAAPQYLAQREAITHPKELQSLQRLSWFSNQKSPFAWQLVSKGESITLRQQEGLLFDDPDVAIAACMAGAGICPSAPFAVEEWVRQGALVPVLPHWSFAARPIHIMYSSNQYLSVRVRSFVDWVIALMQSNPAIGMTPLELAQKLEQASIAPAPTPPTQQPKTSTRTRSRSKGPASPS